MRARALAFIAFLLVSVSLFSQEKESIKYSNITEFGFFTTSPRSVAFEATSIQGFSIDKKHHLGLGFGIGWVNKSYRVNYEYGTYWDWRSTSYMPIFVNYRLCFKPNKAFSPHANIALGGLFAEDGDGVYSAVTMGFVAKQFSFSSGVSFMAIEEKMKQRIVTYDDWGNYVSAKTAVFREWYYPFGIVLKCGFIF